MPYILLIAGVIVAIFAFLRFFARATPAEIKGFFFVCGLAIYALCTIMLAMTGRLGLSFILLLGLVPPLILYYRRKAKALKALPPPAPKPKDP